jgi:MraZ protein
MANPTPLIVGEFVRTIDERFRLTLPPEMVGALSAQGAAEEQVECVLAKERFGALSLWNRHSWRDKVESGIDLVRQKILAGRLANKLSEVQQFARLLSTRFRDVNLAGRARLVIPEGFREFLAVKAGEDCVVVGAGVCVEIWHPVAWRKYLKRRIPAFGPLFEQLST